jgi:hypothetical protein
MKKIGVNLDHFSIFYDFLKMNKIIDILKRNGGKIIFEINSEYSHPHDQARESHQRSRFEL